MEPARDERGDPGPHEQLAAMNEPQWSPLAMSGATVTVHLLARHGGGPQWSPLAMSGATRSAHRGPQAADRQPQWSPLAMSGATCGGAVGRHRR